MADLIQYSVDRAVARIALDSPGNRNALSSALMTQLEDRLAQASDDEGVRAIELTHTGGTFCAGADLTEAREGGMAKGTRRLIALLRLIVEAPKPVVGSIDGHVRAGGVGLVGACDIVLAGPASTFAFSEVRLGLAPAIISLTTLPRLTARAAGRYYLTGETFGATEAARIGTLTQPPMQSWMRCARAHRKACARRSRSRRADCSTRSTRTAKRSPSSRRGCSVRTRRTRA